MTTAVLMIAMAAGPVAQADDVQSRSASPGDIASMLRDLDSRNYQSRESAEAELRRLGPAIVPLATDFVPRTAEGTLRLRKVLSGAISLWYRELSIRAERGDADVLKKLPGGEAIVGLDREERAWLAATLADRISRLRPPVSEPNAVSAALWKTIPNDDVTEPVSHTTAALFYGIRPGVTLTLSDAYRIKPWLQRRAVVREFRRDTSGTVLKQIAVAYIDRLPRQGQVLLLEAASALDLPGLEKIAVEVLNGSASAADKATALVTLAKSGGQEHLSPILKHLNDREIVARSTNRTSGAPVSVGDVALVAAILIIGQDPKDYGYRSVRRTPGAGFDPESAEQSSWGGTAKARRRFNEWAKKSLPEEQPAPKAAVAGVRT